MSGVRFSYFFRSNETHLKHNASDNEMKNKFDEVGREWRGGDNKMTSKSVVLTSQQAKPKKMMER